MVIADMPRMIARLKSMHSGWLIGGVLTTWAASLLARGGTFLNAYPSMEATQHYLLTLKALLQTSLGSTFFLPVVTVSGEVNRHIPWGASVPLPNGIFVYTSFSGFGWLWPYLFLRLTHLEPDLLSLYICNVLVGLASAVLFALIARNAVNYIDHHQRSCHGNN